MNREQIEAWRAWFINESTEDADSKQELDSLCDLALRGLEAGEPSGMVAVPREPSREWLNKVVCLANVWPTHDVENVPMVYRHAVKAYHKAMLTLSADPEVKP